MKKNIIVGVIIILLGFALMGPFIKYVGCEWNDEVMANVSQYVLRAGFGFLIAGYGVYTIAK